MKAVKNVGYRKLPRIPGQIYKTPEPRWLRVVIFATLLAFGIFLYWDGKENFIWLLPLLCILAIIDIFFSSKTIFANLTETTVTAKLENGEGVKNDDLRNYVLFIKEGQRGPGTSLSKNYKYAVSLVHKGKMHLSDTGQLVMQEYPHSKSHLTITLIDNMLCPINLKEWVASFQAQVQKPLPIVFQSPKIQSDYETGVFRSLEKRAIAR